MSACSGATRYEVRRAGSVRSAWLSRWVPSIRLTARAGTCAQAPPALPAGRHGRRRSRRRGCRLCPYQLPYWRYSPCKEAPLLSCHGGQPPGLPHGGSTRSHRGSTRLSWSSGPVCEAAATVRNCRAAAYGCRRAFLMSKRREAAAAVRRDPAALSRPTILAGHRTGLAR